MRLLCTGARVWRERQTVWRDLEKVRELAQARDQKLTVVHGDAAGADRHVRAWCERTPEVVEEKYPVSPTMWRINGPRAGHLRNAHMVSLGADGCIAFCVPCDKPGPCCGLGGVVLPDGHATHGTHGCMDLARGAGIEVWERWAT
ncbi:hypothetical protein BBK14_34175 [Parafrankia soli]|uniref:YspA cpYpsA-related SLOG domain-containing protein n=1 Tax=Parafrankia soli TaxID=2599596 RepID=A0A1S1Q5D7_9ACTN|nr:SLOG family protein [Parafrankia soli]OHV29150.1 hypothetical protein BBK14_34175 [Parafrankia soli]